MNNSIQAIADEFSGVRTPAELHQATANLVKDELAADFGLVAAMKDGTVRALATEPREWADPDNLLSPVSLPHIAASQGQAYVIDDKSNVRSAAQTEAADHGTDVTYPSILWVPFSEEGFLLAGSRQKSAFSDAALERLGTISTVAALLQGQVAEPQNRSDGQQAVDEAARFLSHDAHNILNVIQGRLQLARETADDEQYTAIDQNIARLGQLIEDTVMLLRTGDQITEVEPVCLKATAEVAWENIDTKDANLYNHASETILADESRLCQLLENLFRNAVDHAASDVDIWFGSLKRGRGFYVMDDGPGIPKEESESLFELGFSTSRDNTGVGLTIVKRIAEAHEWEISVTTGESGGARFEFRGVEAVNE